MEFLYFLFKFFYVKKYQTLINKIESIKVQQISMYPSPNLSNYQHAAHLISAPTRAWVYRSSDLNSHCFSHIPVNCGVSCATKSCLLFEINLKN